jgi:cytochrome c oxidase cbb3-type subunit 3
MRTSRATIALSLVGAVSLMAAYCEREERRLDDRSSPAAPLTVAEVRLQPGPVEITDTADGPFDHNAYGTAEGQTLFGQMNCTGCHANGGGSIGPALMDDKWIYGSTPSQIFASIAEGRTNGMPSWKNRLTDRQIWELVAYVRSLSGLTPKGARPNRDDNMSIKPAPAQTPNAKPKNASRP